MLEGLYNAIDDLKKQYEENPHEIKPALENKKAHEVINVPKEDLKPIKSHSKGCKIYSKLLNENFRLISEDTIKFDSGVIYTKSQWLKLKGASPETIKQVHQIKEVFNGKVF